MTTAPKPTVVSPIDSKMQTLAAFIESHLPAHRRDDASPEITVLARSPHSPIAQSIVRLGALMSERGIRVRALFGIVDARGEAGDWTATDGCIDFQRDVRWARNPRYLDAHEQIVLTDKTCWIGDCMRRDPAKRDALDLPKPNAPEHALFARVSFERLWSLGQPLDIRPGRGKSDALAAELAAAIGGELSAEIETNQ
jgi:hypothetical protein